MTRCGWVMFRECGELLCERRFLIMVKNGLFIGACKASNTALK